MFYGWFVAIDTFNRKQCTLKPSLMTTISVAESKYEIPTPESICIQCVTLNPLVVTFQDGKNDVPVQVERKINIINKSFNLPLDGVREKEKTDVKCRGLLFCHT